METSRNRHSRLAPAQRRPVKPDKVCCCCRLTKPVGEFSQYRYVTCQNRTSVRVSSRCRFCDAARRRERYVTTRTRENAQSRAWKAAHRDHVKAQVRVHREAIRPQVLLSRRASEVKRRLAGYNRCVRSVKALIVQALELARFGDRYLDAYTGDLIASPVIDHVDPLSRGGRHEAENICVTSREQNSSKSDTPLLLWMLRKHHDRLAQAAS